jgi:hypothetical protein
VNKWKVLVDRGSFVTDNVQGQGKIRMNGVIAVTRQVGINGPLIETSIQWHNEILRRILPSGGGGKDVFVHISAVERAGLRSLNEGHRVRD